MSVIGIDPFLGYKDAIFAQGRRLQQITPSDTNELQYYPKSLFITGSGNLCVEPIDGNFDSSGNPITGGIIFAVTVGNEFDLVRVKKVYATNTTATALAVL
jgi:hypothetical protein